jgi:hypothetical protein
MYGRKTIISVAIAAAATLFTTLATAQEAAPAAAPVFVKPVPLMQEGRSFPGTGNEGLITARYTVKADGTTDDVEILGGFSNPFYEDIIRKNIAAWTFTPGSVNGEARDFFNQEYTFRVKVSDTLAISPAVQATLEPIRQSIAAKDFAAARDTINSTLEKEVHSVLDFALMNEMMVTAQMGLGDPFAALAASKRATLSSPGLAGGIEYNLTPELLDGALKQQIVLAATVRQQGEVLSAWQELDALSDAPADAKLEEWIATARQQLESPDPLLQLGKIVADGHWEHVPSRRIFTVADVREGSLSKVVAHCDRRTLELDYQEGVDWTLPPTFGDCTLDFQGKDGTLFTVYEFAQ